MPLKDLPSPWNPPWKAHPRDDLLYVDIVDAGGWPIATDVPIRLAALILHAPELWTLIQRYRDSLPGDVLPDAEAAALSAEIEQLAALAEQAGAEAAAGDLAALDE